MSSQTTSFSSPAPGSANYHASARILIMGPSGSGKTHLAATLSDRGVAAYDADTLSGLCGWYDLQGSKTSFPEEAGKFFLDTHRFLWDRQVLCDFLAPRKRMVMCGMSRNAFEMIDLFDEAYFLNVPEDILAKRLRHPSRLNPMGRTAYQLEYSLSWAQKNEARARTLQIRMLDGAQSIHEILSPVMARLVL